MSTGDILRSLSKTLAFETISGDDLVKLLNPLSQGEMSKLIYQLNGTLIRLWNTTTCTCKFKIFIKNIYLKYFFKNDNNTFIYNVYAMSAQILVTCHYWHFNCWL